ncbi:hypothetical protein P3T20_005079 [Paraburkholderia sp. GAS206C]|uniref:hypothetical protein n=1 Tax=unclassified Paraburkholderia TaxID=2615204 RepID=UPI003D25C6F8
MAIYYTVDRLCLLSQDQEIVLRMLELPEFPDLAAHSSYLFPDGLTDHGMRYLNGSANQPDPSSELVWEYVRRAHFPDKPSRMTSFFVWRTEDEARSFRLESGSHKAPIWRVESGDGFVANMSLLNVSTSVLRVSQLAHFYWRGECGPQIGAMRLPRWEVLLQTPVSVLGQI